MKPLAERMEAKYMPEPNTGCWLWFGSTVNGYGTIRLDRSRQVVKAHRLMYEHAVGPIPEGLQLDHLCRVRCCVNPDHLEPVTQQENMRRGELAAYYARSKAHCPQGHAYDAENTGWRTRNRAGGGTYRACRTCSRERMRARRAQ